MRIIEFLKDSNITTADIYSKHYRPGWVNIACPFCSGHGGHHLGINLKSEYCYCWRCGHKPLLKVVQIVSNTNYIEAKELLKQYGGKSFIQIKSDMIKESFDLPKTIPFTKKHITYLQERGFDPDTLIKAWDLKATSYSGYLEKSDYRYRIIIPIYWNGKLVSFQGRDITNKSDLKYKACPKNREIIEHKHTLFGKQDYWADTGICVEGVFDVFKLGFEAFSTYGIEYTAKQVLEIKKHFKRVIIIYDKEPQAQVQAKKLCADLSFRGVDAFIETVEDDPGALSLEEAVYLKKQVFRKIY